jgi:hypothetical protein
MRIAALVVALAAASIAPANVRAQEQPAEAETEGARALFDQGLRYVAERDWSNAIASFRASLRLRRAPAIEYNLAAALVEVGALDEAAQLIVSVLQNPDTREAVRAPTEALEARIREASGALVISVQGTDAGSVEVSLDATPVPAERIGERLTVARGAHEVTAARDGEVVARVSVEVSGESTAAAELVLPPTPAETAEAAAAAETRANETQSRTSGPGLGVWIGIGAGAAVLVAAVVVIVVLATSGGGEAVEGTFQPGVLTWP